MFVRDLMTIGVPVCRDAELCGAVAARLAAPGGGEYVVALDEDGMACGWTTRARLAAAAPDEPVSAVLDEEVPTVGVLDSAGRALEVMRAYNVDVLFLMHDWPGEPRPSALVTRQAIEACERTGEGVNR
jgi:hypothetical protein